MCSSHPGGRAIGRAWDSPWGKVAGVAGAIIGGAIGFALGGPVGALLGIGAGGLIGKLLGGIVDVATGGVAGQMVQNALGSGGMLGLNIAEGIWMIVGARGFDKFYRITATGIWLNRSGGVTLLNLYNNGQPFLRIGWKFEYDLYMKIRLTWLRSKFPWLRRITPRYKDHVRLRPHPPILDDQDNQNRLQLSF